MRVATAPLSISAWHLPPWEAATRPFL